MLIYWAAEARSLVVSSFSHPFFIFVFPSVWKGLISLLILLWCLLSLLCPPNLLIDDDEFSWINSVIRSPFLPKVMALKNLKKASRCNQVSAEVAQLLEAVAVWTVRRFPFFIMGSVWMHLCTVGPCGDMIWDQMGSPVVIQVSCSYTTSLSDLLICPHYKLSKLA